MAGLPQCLNPAVEFSTDMQNPLEQYRSICASYGRLNGTKEFIRKSYVKGLQVVCKPLVANMGDVIWESDWDVLVVLDACRADVFTEEYGDNPLFESVLSVTSVGSKSPEWMERTFSEEYHEELAKTVYVTGNPFSTFKLDESLLLDVDETWRYAWDDDAGTIWPKPLTDRAIQLYNKHDPERLVIHYMQPHWPYKNGKMFGFHADLLDGGDSKERQESSGLSDEQFNLNEFDLQKTGQLSKESHMEMYRDNLQYIVSELEQTLLNGLDAKKVVFTADHGELFGEWGFYEHQSYLPHSGLRKVPWAVTSAQQNGYVPTPIDPLTETDVDVISRLEDLGYK